MSSRDAGTMCRAGAVQGRDDCCTRARPSAGLCMRCSERDRHRRQYSYAHQQHLRSELRWHQRCCCAHSAVVPWCLPHIMATDTCRMWSAGSGTRSLVLRPPSCLLLHPVILQLEGVWCPRNSALSWSMDTTRHACLWAHPINDSRAPSPVRSPPRRRTSPVPDCARGRIVREYESHAFHKRTIAPTVEFVDASPH